MKNENISKRMIIIMDKIKKQREKLGYSFQDLSDITGISKSTLQRYETGNIKNIPMDKFEILANALRTTPYELMNWEDKNKKNNIKLSNEEKELITKYRQLNKEQQYKVIGYIDSELNNIVKESTSIYRINNKPTYVAEEEAKYNQKVKEELNKE